VYNTEVKINFEHPPAWLYSNDYRSVALRRTIGGSSFLRICNDCGTILATSKRGFPEPLDECPECIPDEENIDH